MSKRCQTFRPWRRFTKKSTIIIRFTDIDVNFDIPRQSPIQVLTSLVLLNLSNQMRTGVFNQIWSQALGSVSGPFINVCLVKKSAFAENAFLFIMA